VTDRPINITDKAECIKLVLAQGNQEAGVEKRKEGLREGKEMKICKYYYK